MFDEFEFDTNVWDPLNGGIPPVTTTTSIDTDIHIGWTPAGNQGPTIGGM